MNFHLNNSESPLPMDSLCQVWLKLMESSQKLSLAKTDNRLQTNCDQKNSLGYMAQVI